MINNNLLKFGYGDISVGSNPFGIITFQQFKPPLICGENVPDSVEVIGGKISILITFDKYLELSKLLKDMNNTGLYVFGFNNYVFDFTKYNIKSVETVMKHLKNAISGYFMCCAA